MDAGNFFAPNSRATDIKSVVSWKELERLRYDAVTLGRREIENWSVARQLLANSPLPLVTTNLFVKRGQAWEPVGAPFLIVERAGVRMAILGLLARSEVPEWMIRSASDSLRVLPMIPAALRTRSQLASDVDLVIALVSDTPRRSSSPAPELPAADIIIHGQGQCTIGENAIDVGGTRGRSLGLVRVVVSPSGEISSYQGRSVALTGSMAEDPKIADDARKVCAVSKQLQDEVRQGRGRRRPAVSP
jgi:2',3'-cyclic-nucleotide 2'-phosphodiesterase (5'-nucleotidase family)